MKTSQIILSCCCVLAAVLTVCYSKPQWRPQGRFGKRTDLSSTTDTDKRSPWRPQGRFGKRTLAGKYSIQYFITKKQQARQHWQEVEGKFISTRSRDITFVQI